MKGRRSCVSWYPYQDFLEAFPSQEVVADRLFLADGPRITCAGGAGAAALATHLIERHLGSAVAQKASQVLLFDKPRLGSDAQPHPPMSETVSEPRVRRALLLMEQNLNRPIAIATVADELGMSVRHLERQQPVVKPDAVDMVSTANWGRVKNEIKGLIRGGGHIGRHGLRGDRRRAASGRGKRLDRPRRGHRHGDTALGEYPERPDFDAGHDWRDVATTQRLDTRRLHQGPAE